MNPAPILLDGAQGTRLWELAQNAGVARDSVWKYNIEHPELVAQVCREYAEAGSEIICANTFSANRLSVSRESTYGAAEVVRAGVEIAKKTLEGTKVRTALDIGMLPEFMDPFGDLEEDEVAGIYEEMLSAGVDAGADIIFLETFMDADMIRVAAEQAKKYSLPVVCSLSFEKNGRTMLGSSVEDIVELLEPIGIDGVGLNCSLGPDQAVPVIRAFRACTDLPLFFKPNAGVPEPGQLTTGESPEHFAAQVEPVLDIVSYVGGCCGTDPRFIREIGKLIGK